MLNFVRMNEGMNIGFLKNRIDILLAKFDESQVINYRYRS